LRKRRSHEDGRGVGGDCQQAVKSLTGLDHFCHRLETIHLAGLCLALDSVAHLTDYSRRMQDAITFFLDEGRREFERTHPRSAGVFEELAGRTSVGLHRAAYSISSMREMTTCFEELEEFLATAARLAQRFDAEVLPPLRKRGLPTETKLRQAFTSAARVKREAIALANELEVWYYSRRRDVSAKRVSLARIGHAPPANGAGRIVEHPP